MKVIVLSTIFLLFSLLLVYCTNKKTNKVNRYTSEIPAGPMRDSLFHLLMDLTGNAINESAQFDSIYFLIVPIDVTCNSCRDKCVQEIVDHKANFKSGRYAVISGASVKSIKAFFVQQEIENPENRSSIFIDQDNKAFIKELIYSQPMIYRCFNKKVYEKTLITPKTIQNDLKSFFNA